MKQYIYLLGFIMALVLAGCSSDEAEKDSIYGSISGSVSDKTTGEPVPTVSVLVVENGKSTVTGSDGSFSFINLEPGSYTIEVSMDGYSGSSKTVSVRAGDPTMTHLLIERLPAQITSDKEELDFGNQIETLSFKIVNRGYRDLEYSIETGTCNWLVVTPTKGTLQYGKTETIVVKALRDQLQSGQNEAVIVVRSLSGDGNVEIKVTAVNSNETASVNTLAPTNISNNSATLNGEIGKIGEPKYKERGFVYSTNPTPTVGDCIQKLSAPVNTDSKFSCNIQNLSPLSTYYVRTYIVQNESVIYGNILSFTTSGEPTTVTTSAATSVSATSATLNGSIVQAGTPVFTEKGFCYSTSPNPTTASNRLAVPGTSVGNFSLELKNLNYPVTYYACAYAIQNGAPVYGNVISFNTSGQDAVVSTSAVTDVMTSTATFNGNILNVGNPPYNERGFCYSTYGNPTIADKKVMVSGTGQGMFSIKVNNLQYPENYNVCAYVIQNGEVIYGNVVSFSTKTFKASVNTSAVTNITTTGATFNGIVTDLGVPTATRRGFCYSAYNQNPTINDSHVDDYYVNLANYTKNVTGLSAGTTYYVRAYVYQDGEYIYGNPVNFTTNSEPVVYTNAATNLTKQGTMFFTWSVTLNGTVAIAGNPPYDQRGFVYGTTVNPTTSNGTVVTASGNGTGKFSSKVSNLQDMKTYYIRAFVKIGKIYYYGENVTVNTI